MSLTDGSLPQMDDQDMMSLLDGSMFGNLDSSMPMNLDNPSNDESSVMASYGMAPPTQAMNSGGMGSVGMGDGAMSGAMTNDQQQQQQQNQLVQQQQFSNQMNGNANGNNHNMGGDEGAIGVPGAGPQPASTPQPNPASGNMLTEFTKRRNWPAKVVEELKDLLHILDANGRIRYSSPSTLALTGYTAEEIADSFLKDFIHSDDVGVFVAELNESIASGNPLRMFYRFKKKDGSNAIFETVGHAHIAAAKFAPNPHNQSPFCQAVFMMSRPYPSKNSCLLDSFLEHKIENERLRRRIAELRKEEIADVASSRDYYNSQDARSEATPSESMVTSSMGGATPALVRQQSSSSMPPPPTTNNNNTGSGEKSPVNPSLTREALEDVAHSRPDSLKEKMARFEGSHTDTIEMLTGLRYIEGERSKGITTGNASPTLIKGDAGIAIPMDRDPRTGEKKKKLKTTEEYVCTDCGTLDSPEWRKGPSGPKTLCNACGLRWAKKEKKTKHGSNNKNGGGGGAGNGMSNTSMPPPASGMQFDQPMGMS